MRYLARQTGKALATVDAAKDWLYEHGAFDLVPYDKRLGKELTLPVRQHVYELTGTLTFGDRVIHYLYFEDQENGQVDVSLAEISTAESSNQQNVKSLKDSKESEDSNGLKPAAPLQSNSGAPRPLHFGKQPISLARKEEEAKKVAQDSQSELARRIALASHSRKGVLAKEQQAMLFQPVKVNGMDFASPESLYNDKLYGERFKAYVETKITYYSNQDIAQSSYLVNLVRQYEGKYGWLEYAEQAAGSVPTSYEETSF
jgi:hypothetical protein